MESARDHNLLNHNKEKITTRNKKKNARYRIRGLGEGMEE